MISLSCNVGGTIVVDGSGRGDKVVINCGLYVVRVTRGSKVGGSVGVGLRGGLQAISPTMIKRKESRNNISRRIR